MPIKATICQIIVNNKILLQYKNVDKFGGGKWNGPGGKIASEETPREGVIREVLEETGLKICEPKLYGVLDFYFNKKHDPDWTCYIFRTNSFLGIPKNLGEGELKWFNLNEIPYSDMWEDDKYWLPLLLKSKKFKGYFIYDQQGKTLLEHHLKVLT
jgi:8-oxo-dGTP pyrophosphatase MutT (NUDIX family)